MERAGAVSPEAVGLMSSLRPLMEVLDEQAADRQQPTVRGRGRGRGAFAAANMKRAAAALLSINKKCASPTRVGRRQQQPEVAAAEETERAVKQLEAAIQNILPPSSN